MIKQWIGTDRQSFLKRLVLVAVSIALPVIAWAQWTTSGNNIYNTNSGNVGIGSTSPVTALQIKGTADGYTEVMLDGTAASGDQWTIGTGWSSPGLSNFYWYNNTSPNAGVKMVLTPTGHLGIGTNSPSSALQVVGDVTVSGNIAAKYQDLAEWVPASQSIPAGSVVILDPSHDNSVMQSTAPYDTTVAGVISSTPGIVLGEGGEGKVRVATTGRVRIRVDAGRGAIKVGDLLVTSDKEGMAMRSEPIDVAGIKIHRPGTLIGKALQPLAEGEGEILVLLSLQ